MRAGRGGGRKKKENFRAASESLLKRGEIEVKSESFTPPGEAAATSGAGDRRKRRRRRKNERTGGGGEEPPGSHSRVMG